jgi:hypothetical protein
MMIKSYGRELLDATNSILPYCTTSGPRCVHVEVNPTCNLRNGYETSFHADLSLAASAMRRSSVLKSKPSNATS